MQRIVQSAGELSVNSVNRPSSSLKTIARAHLVYPAVTRWCHCVTRCMRQAFLLGEGPEHRKKRRECPPSQPTRSPLSGIDGGVRPSKIVAVGSGSRGEKSNDRSQIMRDLLEDAGLHPAPGWLVDCGPRRKIDCQEAPPTARPDQVTYRAQQIAQDMFAVSSILAHLRVVFMPQHEQSSYNQSKTASRIQRESPSTLVWRRRRPGR